MATLCAGFRKTRRDSFSINVRITMIRCIVYLLRIFKMFHGLMNNPVNGCARNCALETYKNFRHKLRNCITILSFVTIINDYLSEESLLIYRIFCSKCSQKIQVFWNWTQWSSERAKYLVGTYRLHLQGKRVSQVRNRKKRGKLSFNFKK
jgi:hypothetical protein